jgi:hypothetical protein
MNWHVRAPLSRLALRSAACLTMIWISGCNAKDQLSIPTVVAAISNNCSWAQEIRLTLASKEALRKAQKDHPEIRTDREALAAYNMAVEKNCPK